MNNRLIIKSSEAVLYCMPSLEEERVVQETPEMIFERAGEIQRQAYEEGFASGENAGFTAGEQKALLLTDRLEKIIGELAALKERLIREAETQVVDLAVSIAAKITVGEINTKPEIIISMVREALKRLQVVGPITIKINPALYDLFTAKKPELTAVHEDIVFDVNPNVPVTGPLVISQSQEVVTDIESLFRNILKEIKIIDRTRNTVTEGDEEEEGAAE